MALETYQDIITDIRYDLRDTAPMQYTKEELLAYIKRVLRMLDSALIAADSEWVKPREPDTRTLSSGSDYVQMPDYFVDLQQNSDGYALLYTSDNRLAIRKSPGYINYQREANSGSTGEPNFFAVQGKDIIFDLTADDDYTITSYIIRRSSDPALTDDAPYNDEFNDILRQGAIMYAKNRQEYDITGAAVLYGVIESAVMARVVGRSHVPGKKRIDF